MHVHGPSSIVWHNFDGPKTLCGLTIPPTWIYEDPSPQAHPGKFQFRLCENCGGEDEEE